MKIPPEFSELKLGDIPFTETKFMRELGINICTDPKVKNSDSMLKKYGYFLSPECKRLKSIAYRLQQVKNDFPPYFLRMMVVAYFVGVARFGSCLYWCRGIQSELDECRFYYCMALASILKLSTLEVLGGSVCGAMSCSAENKSYIRLLKITGMPSLKDMAMTDALATIKQVVRLKPEFFGDVSSCEGVDLSRHSKSKYFSDNDAGRVRRLPDRFGEQAGGVRIEDKDPVVIEHCLPSSLSSVVVETDAVVGDVWRLACLGAKRKTIKSGYTQNKYSELYEVAKRFSNDSKGSELDALDHYRMLCLMEFDVVEPQLRRLNFRTPTKQLIPNRVCKVAPPSWAKKASKKKLFFNCSMSPPDVEEMAGTDCQTCVICGYSAYFLDAEMRNCKLCKRAAHVVCIDKLFIQRSLFKCSLVTRFLGRNGSELFGSSGIVGRQVELPVPRKK